MILYYIHSKTNKYLKDMYNTSDKVDFISSLFCFLSDLIMGQHHES